MYISGHQGFQEFHNLEQFLFYLFLTDKRRVADYIHTSTGILDLLVPSFTFRPHKMGVFKASGAAYPCRDHTKITTKQASIPPLIPPRESRGRPARSAPADYINATPGIPSLFLAYPPQLYSRTLTHDEAHHSSATP